VTDERSIPQDLLDFLRAAARVPGAGHHDGARPAAAEAERQAGPRPAAVAAAGVADARWRAVGRRNGGLGPADRPGRSGRRLLRGRWQLAAGRPTGRTGQQKLGIDDEHNYLLVTNLLNEPTLPAFISTVEEVLRAGRVPQETCTAPVDRWRPDVGWYLTHAGPGLGMCEADWEREAARADVIHHCGAEVNFLYPYEKLRAANVFGTQEVLRLAARREIPVHHVSTTSVVHGMGVAGVRRVTEDTGNETTKNATTGGPVAFSRIPDRWHLLRRQPELLDSAVEEILRYTSVRSASTATPPRRLQPASTSGWLIQAKGWLIQLRPTGRNELTE